MQKLLELLKDGNSRTVEMLSRDLNTTVEDVRRRMEYLEKIGAIRKIPFMTGNDTNGSCSCCKGCDGGNNTVCKGCMPKGVVYNMGNLWEVV
ncbi:MAG: Lrp/AsnC family transcriptional regulator [Lachnospiraceae bacterium]|nr:Lrp/AsnC family transcriptional regulator [Lachnospiraceae bacterium]